TAILLRECRAGTARDHRADLADPGAAVAERLHFITVPRCRYDRPDTSAAATRGPATRCPSSLAWCGRAGIARIVDKPGFQCAHPGSTEAERSFAPDRDRASVDRGHLWVHAGGLSGGDGWDR